MPLTSAPETAIVVHGNGYRMHVEELKQKHGAPDSPWGTKTNIDPMEV